MSFFFFFNDTATTEIYTLSLHDALPISAYGWDGGFGPFLVGILVWAIGLSLGGPTGYAINPARDLGPRLAHAVLPIAGKGNSDWGYAWIPVAGPIIGGLVAAFLYKAVWPA